MKYFLRVGFLLLLSVPCNAQQTICGSDLNRNVQRKLAEFQELHRQKQTQQASILIRQVYNDPCTRRLGFAWASIVYNLSAIESLLGHADDAIIHLREAVDAGFAQFDLVLKDTDLDKIRQDVRFKRILADLEAQKGFWENPALATPFGENISEDEKIAGLSRFWSDVKYNFAYFDRVPNLDWDKVYLAYLPRIRQTKNTVEYYRVLQEMCALLKDGHTFVSPPQEIASEFYSRPLIETYEVEDRVLISEVLDNDLLQHGVGPGLEVIRVDGIPVREYAEKRIARYVNSSTKQGFEDLLYGFFLLAGSDKEPVNLTLQDSQGKVFTQSQLRFSSVERRKRIPPSPPLKFKVLEGNIAYVSLDTFDDNSIVKDFDAIYSQINDTDALILDVRNNSGGNANLGFSILGYLTNQPFKISRWRTREYRPSFRAWGLGQQWYGEPVIEEPNNGAHLYTNPVVVLIGPRTGSAAEDFCVAFDYMKRGKMIGGPTAGVTGISLFLSLPGGGRARICTKRDTYPDGKEFVGIGVQPDILVRQTVKGIRSGQDEVLDAAINHLKETRKAN